MRRNSQSFPSFKIKQTFVERIPESVKLGNSITKKQRTYFPSSSLQGRGFYAKSRWDKRFSVAQIQFSKSSDKKRAAAPTRIIFPGIPPKANPVPMQMYSVWSNNYYPLSGASEDIGKATNVPDVVFPLQLYPGVSLMVLLLSGLCSGCVSLLYISPTKPMEQLRSGVMSLFFSRH